MNTQPHTLLKHTDCQVSICIICHGGINYCTTCKGAEGSLSTDCIGRELTDNEEIAISNGDDFINGKWRRAS